MAKQNKVLIVEHSPIVAEGLERMLEDADFDVVAVCTELNKAMERLPLLKPNAIVLNPMQLDFSKRLMLRSLFQDYPQMLLVAMQTSYCEQSVLGQFHAVLDLEDNAFRISSKMKSATGNLSQEMGNSSGCELSLREKEVLKAISKGYTSKQVADELHLSVHTVVTHRKNISHKTGIKTVSGLTLYALLNHLIDENEMQ